MGRFSGVLGFSLRSLEHRNHGVGSFCLCKLCSLLMGKKKGGYVHVGAVDPGHVWPSLERTTV